jgi:hypothetical protein
MPDFSNAKKGDKVYSLSYGKGKITYIYPLGDLEVMFYDKEGTDFSQSFTKEGKEWENSPCPVLFWEKPIISYPPMPKRKEKRKEIGFAYVLNDQKNHITIGTVYKEKHLLFEGIKHEFPIGKVIINWEENQ